MTKGQRQSLLLRVIRDHSVRTQEELCELLQGEGVEVSQVTLSRDLRDLGVVKTGEGYREAGAVMPGPPENLHRVIREFVLEATPAQNLVVLRTNPGGASAVALALDRSGWDEIVGTVAGDDTIFVAAPDARSARELQRKLLEML